MILSEKEEHGTALLFKLAFSSAVSEQSLLILKTRAD
jgi:hypothetical protein